MAAKANRIEELRKALRANGVESGTTDPDIQGLNDWFYANAEPDPDRPGHLLPDWYSVVIDVGLFLGEFFTRGDVGGDVEGAIRRRRRSRATFCA
jgi:hypothetical protein